MVTACVEIATTRDVGRQILRHRSFSFQEKSGRYSEFAKFGEVKREVRMRDEVNRQNSLECTDAGIQEWWDDLLQNLNDTIGAAYVSAVDKGIAPEVARIILPEGLTPTRMYMAGTLRSWIHYWGVRCGPETQKEHRIVAQQTMATILPDFPMIREALAIE